MKKKRERLYDEKCHDLARYFLGNEESEDAVATLAVDFQLVAEDFVGALEALRDGRAAAEDVKIDTSDIPEVGEDWFKAAKLREPK